MEELFEVKLSDLSIDSSIRYFNEKLKPKAAYQIVGNLTKSYLSDGIRVISPIELFAKPLEEWAHV